VEIAGVLPGAPPAAGARGGVACRAVRVADAGEGDTEGCETRLGLEPTSSSGCSEGPTLSRGLSPRWLKRARGVRCGVPATRRPEGSHEVHFQLNLSIFRVL
jgi:hypothetical protein